MTVLGAILSLVGPIPPFFGRGRPLSERDKAKRSPELKAALLKAAEEKRAKRAMKRK